MIAVQICDVSLHVASKELRIKGINALDNGSIKVASIKVET